jgi:hypothetical protein
VIFLRKSNNINGKNTNHEIRLVKTYKQQARNKSQKTTFLQLDKFCFGKEDTRNKHAMSLYGTTESNVSNITLEILHFFELQMQKYHIHCSYLCSVKIYIYMYFCLQGGKWLYVYVNIERILRGAEGVLTF